MLFATCIGLLHTHSHTHTFKHTYIYTHTYAHTLAQSRDVHDLQMPYYTHVQILIHTTYIRTYIHTYVLHTYIHTYMHTCIPCTHTAYELRTHRYTHSIQAQSTHTHTEYASSAYIHAHTHTQHASSAYIHAYIYTHTKHTSSVYTHTHTYTHQASSAKCSSRPLAGTPSCARPCHECVPHSCTTHRQRFTRPMCCSMPASRRKRSASRDARLLLSRGICGDDDTYSDYACMCEFTGCASFCVGSMCTQRIDICMYVCVCMYVRTWVCMMYLCVYVCTNVCMYLCMYVYIHISKPC
jgi:hypothetical protein